MLMKVVTWVKYIKLRTAPRHGFTTKEEQRWPEKTSTSALLSTILAFASTDRNKNTVFYSAISVCPLPMGDGPIHDGCRGNVSVRTRLFIIIVL